MRLKTTLLSALSLLALSLPAQAMAQQLTIDRQALDAELPWLSLTPLATVHQRASRTLVRELGIADAADKLKIARVYTSDWFHATLDEQRYVIDATASYWLQGEQQSFFLFQNGVHHVNVDNSARVDMMALSGLLSEWRDDLVTYPARDSGAQQTQTLYVFIDISCPFCQRFHLTKRAEYQAVGYDIVYVPFLKDLNNRRVASLTRYIFCQPDQALRRSMLDQVYLNGVRATYLPEMREVGCAAPQAALVEYLMTVGHRFRLQGSPMLLTETGQLHYGTSAFERNLNMIKEQR